MALRRRSSRRFTSRTTTVATLLCLAVGVCALLATGHLPTGPKGGIAHVELMVYSGRANPTFELTPAETEVLVRKLERLPAGAAPPGAPGLGYSGLLVTFDGVGLPERVTAYNGVRLEGDDNRLDTEDVEGWLLDKARQRGYADLLSSVGL